MSLVAGCSISMSTVRHFQVQREQDRHLRDLPLNVRCSSFALCFLFMYNVKKSAACGAMRPGAAVMKAVSCARPLFINLYL